MTFLSAIISHQMRPSDAKSEKVLKLPPSAVNPLTVVFSYVMVDVCDICVVCQPHPLLSLAASLTDGSAHILHFLIISLPLLPNILHSFIPILS